MPKTVNNYDNNNNYKKNQCQFEDIETGKQFVKSIGSTVSDAIVRSWLWLTATRSSPVGCFSALLKVVDN